MRLSVDSMILDDAIELLDVRSERHDESREDAISVVETLGRLPLAIDQAAAYIRYTRHSFQKFVQDFCERKDILVDADLPIFWDYKKKRRSGQDNTETDRKLGVWTTWQLSLDLLEAGNNGASCVHLLTLSAILNGRNISQAFLGPWLKYFGDTINSSPPVEDLLLESERPNIAQRALERMDRPLSEDIGLIEDKFLRFVADAYNLSCPNTNARHTWCLLFDTSTRY
jgi:hypothetical protein